MIVSVQTSIQTCNAHIQKNGAFHFACWCLGIKNKKQKTKKKNSADTQRYVFPPLKDAYVIRFPCLLCEPPCCWLVWLHFSKHRPSKKQNRKRNKNSCVCLFWVKCTYVVFLVISEGLDHLVRWRGAGSRGCLRWTCLVKFFENTFRVHFGTQAFMDHWKLKNTSEAYIS
jgi:hypothetical protein